MSRRRKWLAAGTLALLVTVIFGARLGPPSRTAHPGLSLRFVGFTNINGQGSAQMSLTNQSGHLHFVDAWGGIPKYSGAARTPDATHRLRSPNSTPCLFGLPPHTAYDFTVDLPKGTESWQVSAAGFQGDRLGSALALYSGRLLTWPAWLTKPVMRVIYGRIWNRDFEVSSGILTNRPPEP